MSFDLFSRLPHLPTRNLIHERLISQSIFSAPTDDDGQHQFGSLTQLPEKSHSEAIPKKGHG